MVLNDTETWTNSTTVVSQESSLYACPKSPDLTFDLDATTFPWILISVKSFACLSISFLNLLVFTAVRVRKELSKHSYVLLSSLAGADFLVGTLTMPFSASLDVLLAIRRVTYFCTLDIVNVYLMYCASWCALYHMTAIAWERFVAITKTVLYPVIVTRGRLRTLATVVWMGAILTTLPPFGLEAAGLDLMFVEMWIFFASICGAVSLIATGYFYVKIYIEVRKRKIDQITQVTVLAQAKLETKVAKTAALLTLALVISFVPGIVVSSSPTLRTSTSIRVSELIMQMGSIVNPLLYCYRDRRFRNALLEMLRMKKPQVIQRPANAAMPVHRVQEKVPMNSKNALPKETPRETRTDGFTRSASCTSLNTELNRLSHQTTCHKTLTRSMSAPSFAQFNAAFESNQMPLPSTLTRTETFHGEIKPASKPEN